MDERLTLRLVSNDREVFMLSGKIRSEPIEGLETNVYWDSCYGELDDLLKRGGGEFNESEKTVREAQEYLMGLAEFKSIRPYQISMKVGV